MITLTQFLVEADKLGMTDAQRRSEADLLRRDRKETEKGGPHAKMSRSMQRKQQERRFTNRRQGKPEDPPSKALPHAHDWFRRQERERRRQEEIKSRKDEPLDLPPLEKAKPKALPKPVRPQAIDRSEVKVSHEPPAGVRIRFSHGRPILMSAADAKAFTDAIRKIASGRGKPTVIKSIQLDGGKAKITIRFSDQEAYALSPDLADDLVGRVQALTKGVVSTKPGRSKTDPGPVLRKIKVLAKKHGTSPTTLLALIGTYAGVGRPTGKDALEMVTYFLGRMDKTEFLLRAEEIAQKHHRVRKRKDGSYT
jgi:hypothetical protein